MKKYQQKYDREILNSFYEYWTRMCGDEMKFELEEKFQVGRRLATWKRLQPKYNPTPKQLWENLFHNTR